MCCAGTSPYGKPLSSAYHGPGVGALVDSGADVSVFHVSVAQLLHIDLADCRRLAMGGAGGTVSTQGCEVELDVEGRRFRAEAQFVASKNAPLGREHVLMRFTFAFDPRAHTLLVEPCEG